MNKKEVAQVLAILKAAYPNTKNIDDASATLEAYWMAWKDYSSETITRAARLHMETSKFFPAASEILDKIVRAEIVYGSTGMPYNRLEGKKEETMLLESGESIEERLEAIEKKLDELCKFIGFGYPKED